MSSAARQGFRFLVVAMALGVVTGVEKASGAIISNSGFENATASPWTLGAGTTLNTDTTNVSGGLKSLQIVNTGSPVNTRATQRVLVTAGDPFQISFDIKIPTTLTGSGFGGIFAEFYTAPTGGTFISGYYPTQRNLATTGFLTIVGSTVVVPAGAQSAVIYAGIHNRQGTAYIDNVVGNAIPEPASLSLLSLGGLMLLRRRSRTA